MEFSYHIEGGDFSKAGLASSEVKKILKQLNVSASVIKRVVVAHAYEGDVRVDIAPERVVVVVEDRGPGIPDIPLAMQEGYSTASAAVREMGFGAGMGLPNMRKNSDELNIESEVGKGTKVTMLTRFNP